MTRTKTDGDLAGVAYALLAFGAWGAMPIYIKALGFLGPLVIMAHRIFWSFVFTGALVLLLRRGSELRAAWNDPKSRRMLYASALFISANWLLYIWAVAHARVVEASMGYFINPLANVLLGVLVLRERLDALQSLALACAAAGVAFYLYDLGHVPWIALTLAITFALYGLTRKTVAAGPLTGLFVETGLLAPVALAILGYAAWGMFQVPVDGGTTAGATESQAVAAGVTEGGVVVAASGSVAEAWRALLSPWWHVALPLAAGVFTALPLLWFAKAVRRLSLSTIGLLQYSSPSLQLLVGVFLFGEEFTRTHAVVFACIWSGLALISARAVLVAAGRGR